MGEWVNATKQLVEFACMDVQRRAAQRSERETSLDARDDDPDDDGADWTRRRAGPAAVTRRDEERADAADFVAWALPQIADDRRRLVLERTLDGVAGGGHRRRARTSAWPTSTRSARAP